MPVRDVRLQAAILRGRHLLVLHGRLPGGGAFWLLPGGTREPGETDQAALAREVREELGVEVAVGALLTDVPAAPSDGTYRRWRTYRCALTRGEPAAQGADGAAALDAVAWLPLDDEAGWAEEVRADPFLAPQLRHVRDALGPAGAPAPPLGLGSGVVRLATPDPAWPALFAAERARLLAAAHAAPAGPLDLAVEHVGSTAVPGLAAKPILDLLAGRPEGSDPAAYVGAFERAGYRHRGEHGLPGRHYCVRDDAAGRRTHHLHLVARGGALWHAHLACRDALRTDPARAAAYAALKRDLAARHPRDRAAYTDGKAAFVRETVADTLARVSAAPAPGA